MVKRICLRPEEVSTYLRFISLLSRWWNMGDQFRGQSINCKDHVARQLSVKLGVSEHFLAWGSRGLPKLFRHVCHSTSRFGMLCWWQGQRRWQRPLSVLWVTVFETAAAWTVGEWSPGCQRLVLHLPGDAFRRARCFGGKFKISNWFWTWTSAGE